MREKNLTDAEKSNILLLKKLKLSNKKISNQINRNNIFVTVFSSDPENYGLKRNFNCKNKERPKTVKKICRLVSNKSITNLQLKANLEYSVAKRTILRYLNDTGNLKYLKK